MENTSVSIIIPMYNVSEYIEQCIQSIINQTHKNIEVILVDDGSTDNTYSLAEKYLKQDFRIKLFKTSNKGPAHARNFGITQSSGDYYMFVDSDDFLPIEGVEILLNTILTTNVKLALGKTLRTNGIKKWEVPSHLKYSLNDNNLKNIITNGELFYAIGPAAKIYHKDLLRENSYSESMLFAEDQLFVLRAYLNSLEVATTTKVVYYYRVREGDNKSLTQVYNKNIFLNLENIFFNIESSYNIIQQTVTISEELKKNIFLSYISRLCEIELRVLFKAALVSSEDVQQKFFSEVSEEFLKNDTTTLLLIGETKNFKKYIVDDICTFYFSIKQNAMAQVLNFLNLVLEKNQDVKNSPFVHEIIKAESSKFKREFLRIKTFGKYLSNRIVRRVR